MMYNNGLYDNLKDLAIEYLNSGKDPDEIEKLLNQKTDDKLLLAVILKEIKKINHATNRKKGLQKLALAGILLFSGFIITCINFHYNQPFAAALYGLTAAGLVFMFWGLYNIIG